METPEPAAFGQLLNLASQKGVPYQLFSRPNALYLTQFVCQQYLRRGRKSLKQIGGNGGVFLLSPVSSEGLSK